MGVFKNKSKVKGFGLDRKPDVQRMASQSWAEKVLCTQRLKEEDLGPGRFWRNNIPGRGTYNAWEGPGQGVPVA